MMSHPHPDERILIPYMHQNLVQISRYWMAKILLLGKCPRLPPTTTLSIPFSKTIPAMAMDYITWSVLSLISSPPNSSEAGTSSPSHDMINSHYVGLLNQAMTTIPNGTGFAETNSDRAQHNTSFPLSNSTSTHTTAAARL
jgi:hypothetical protein